MLSIDLNCDMGESTGLWPYSIDKDFSLLKYVSSANIACGYHAGDAHTMHQLTATAILNNVAVGAHPGFPDRENFGRTNMSLSPEKVYDIILYQVASLAAFAKVHGTKLHHVKPHGALYNMAAKDRILAKAVCNAIKDFDEDLILYGLAGSELIAAAKDIGLKVLSEVFADRTYQDDGNLTPRTEANAMIEDVNKSVRQVLQMVKQGVVQSTNGKEIPIVADSICIHGDGINALEFAKMIYYSLRQNGIEIKPI